MSKVIRTEKVRLMTCDECGKEETIYAVETDILWLEIKTVEADGLRLFQRSEELRRYESFHIPNQTVSVYCGKECMLKSLKSSVEFFAEEIAPSRKLGKRRSEIEIS